ncbi:MAG: CapA family protein [Chlamydiota bacterium]
MVFLGDIAAPRELLPQLSETPCFPAPVVAGLEGALLENADGWRRHNVSFNDTGVAAALSRLNVRAVTLANNHILDINAWPSATVEQLRRHGIAACGAGDNAEEAAAAAVLDDQGCEVRLLAFGWPVIGCRPAQRARPGVNPLHPEHVLSSVRALRHARPASKIVLLMHWDYELELYPQPLHRQLARAAIEEGADLVVGSHSHCAQGIEFHRGLPIVYGLGNWFVPHGVYYGGKLRYPAFACEQLTFEWHPDRGDSMCHWFQYCPSRHIVTHLNSESPVASERVARLTPFAGMADGDYRRWFGKNRRKRRALPVFADMHSNFTNDCKALWVGIRQLAIDTANNLGLKGEPR